MCSKTREQKIRLFKRHPYCYWCGRKLVLTNIKNGILPKNAATIDHLYSRLSPKRSLPNTNNEIRHVLACRRCNHKRGKFEDKALPYEEKLKRSRGLN